MLQGLIGGVEDLILKKRVSHRILWFALFVWAMLFIDVSTMSDG